MVSGEIEGSLSSSKMIFWNRISFTKLDATKFILELFDPVKVQFICSNTGLNHISRIFWISFLPNVVSTISLFIKPLLTAWCFKRDFREQSHFQFIPKDWRRLEIQNQLKEKTQCERYTASKRFHIVNSIQLVFIWKLNN